MPSTDPIDDVPVFMIAVSFDSSPPSLVETVSFPLLLDVLSRQNAYHQQLITAHERSAESERVLI